MNIIAKKGKLLEEKTDLLVFGLFVDYKINSGALGEADKALGGLIAKLAQGENFSGKSDEQLVLHTHGKLPAARVLLVGLGEKKLFNAEIIRRAAGFVVKYASKTGVRKICSPTAWNSLNAIESTQALSEGAFLADYQYLIFKPEEAKRLKKRGLVTWTLLDEETNIIRAAEKGIAQGEISSRATVYARDLVNEPGSRMTPTHLKEHAEKIAAQGKRIKLKVFDRMACEKWE
jgi:leucyl aminopeptidase